MKGLGILDRFRPAAHAAPGAPVPANAAPAPRAATFTPRPAAATQPFPAPAPAVSETAMPANAAAAPAPAPAAPLAVPQGSHARAGRRHVPQPPALLERVRDGIRDLPPAPAALFASDFRMPGFRATARQVGWCGLHMAPAPAGWQVWTVDRWHRQARAAIAAQADAAYAEIVHYLAERGRREERLREAADAAPALGYPGGVL